MLKNITNYFKSGSDITKILVVINAAFLLLLFFTLNLSNKAFIIIFIYSLLASLVLILYRGKLQFDLLDKIEDEIEYLYSSDLDELKKYKVNDDLNTNNNNNNNSKKTQNRLRILLVSRINVPQFKVHQTDAN